MPDNFEVQLSAFAERAMRIRSHCASEEATRIYLVMPFLKLMGYDAGDPSVIVPEHDDSIDFAVMVRGVPDIAVAATGSGTSSSAVHARLRGYWNARDTLKLGVATNGLVYEIFIDSDVPHVLDAEPFLTIDLEAICKQPLDSQKLSLARMVRAVEYDPSALAEQAYAMNLRDRLKDRVLAEFRNPSEALCRLFLEQIGIRDTRPDVIDQHYRSILKTSMEQAIIVPVVQALRRLPAPAHEAIAKIKQATPAASPQEQAKNDVNLADELAAFGRWKRRSA